ncbi:CBS domain-containing protein [Shimia sp. FJ5]|uniref:CBS domain-containing protein n=1 Tax=Shimia sp. FJ5 TaxID=3079054 RepID=UPI00261C6C47|nr:CBS domain-containing protein [Shimia sp. FJ5]MDV4145606.1 CBS domain-containing protein [Shimia sp. FJ5]
MLVHQILKHKGDQGVVTVPPSMTVAEAAKLLDEKRIGTLVISSTGDTADGICSERDIVREVARRGSVCLEIKVEEIMSRNIITCGLGEKADAVLATMTEKRFRHMPVVDAGVMVGFISIGDVVKARLTELAMEKDALEGMIMGH